MSKQHPDRKTDPLYWPQVRLWLYLGSQKGAENNAPSDFLDLLKAAKYRYKPPPEIEPVQNPANLSKEELCEANRKRYKKIEEHVDERHITGFVFREWAEAFLTFSSKHGFPDGVPYAAVNHLLKRNTEYPLINWPVSFNNVQYDGGVSDVGNIVERAKEGDYVVTTLNMSFWENMKQEGVGPFWCFGPDYEIRMTPEQREFFKDFKQVRYVSATVLIDLDAPTRMILDAFLSIRIESSIRSRREHILNCAKELKDCFDKKVVKVIKKDNPFEALNTVDIGDNWIKADMKFDIWTSPTTNIKPKLREWIREHKQKRKLESGKRVKKEMLRIAMAPFLYRRREEIEKIIGKIGKPKNRDIKRGEAGIISLYGGISSPCVICGERDTCNEICDNVRRDLGPDIRWMREDGMMDDGYRKGKKHFRKISLGSDGKKEKKEKIDI